MDSGGFRLRTCTLALALLAGANAAWAQAPRSQQTVPTPQQLAPADQLPSAQQARRRRSDIFEPPEAGPCPLQGSTLTFTLRSVTFTGAEKLDARRLARAYAGQIGRTIPVAEICAIRDRAAELLFARGILARVEVPEQKIADGALTLQVIQARVAAVRFHGDAGPAQARVEALLEHLRGLAPFDLNVAQRYLLLASDIPGVQVSAAIRPSSQGAGAVDLDVTVARKAIDAAVNLQNYGSKTLGRDAGLARLDLNGLTPFGDRSSLVLYTTSDLREQRVAQFIEDVHPFDSGLFLHGSVSYARTRPGDVLSPLDLHGDALTAQIAANYPLIRKRRFDVNLLLGMDYVDEKTDFGGTNDALIDDKLRVLFGRAQGDVRSAPFGVPVELQGGVELRKGLAILGASRKGDSTLSRTEGDADAFVARIDGQLQVRPLPWLAFVGSAVAQDADRPLLTFEELSIGNLTIGRGYDPSSVAGDRGIAGSIEARFGPWAPFPWLTISPYAFYDAAYAKFIDSTGDSVTVHSAGGGLRVLFLQRVDLDVAYVAPFDKPTVSAASIPTPRVLASLTFRY